MPRRSPPKQKWLPAPVRTTARTAALRAQVMAAASRSIAICRLSVLALSGRFRVTSATAPRVSTSILAAAIARYSSGAIRTRSPASSGVNSTWQERREFSR